MAPVIRPISTTGVRRAYTTYFNRLSSMRSFGCCQCSSESPAKGSVGRLSGHRQLLRQRPLASGRHSSSSTPESARRLRRAFRMASPGFFATPQYRYPP
jgi:hypothetical protein